MLLWPCCIIKRLGYGWGYTFRVVEVLIDEIEEGVGVCRVEEIAIGSKVVEGSRYFVCHSCSMHCAYELSMRGYRHGDCPLLVDFY